MAQTVVYQGTTTQLAVVQETNLTYEWEIYSDLAVDFAKEPGNCPVTSATFIGTNTEASVNVNWLQPGIYFYKITVYDATKCVMNFKIGMIKVVSVEIKAIISGDTVVGACRQVKLDASKSLGDIVKYEWILLTQGGELSSQTGIETEFLLSRSFTGSLPADFEVKLLVTNRQGDTNSDIITIKVDRLPIAELYSAGKLDKDGTMVVEAVVVVGKAVDYRWYTSEGKIVGPDNQSTVKLFGAGSYSLEITDSYGCVTTKNFNFPVDLYQIIVNPDYARISWTQDTTINVLENDQSNVEFIPGTVKIIEQPKKGESIVNINGSITYIPHERAQYRDQFVYEVCNTANLCDSATVAIDVYDPLVIPDGLSPNGDGVNDELIFGGLSNYPQSQLYIYSRAGQLIYQSLDYQNNWDGKSMQGKMNNQETVPTGVYYYVLKLGGTNRVVKRFIYVAY
jgi:gliding motility-associated-like protein